MKIWLWSIEQDEDCGCEITVAFGVNATKEGAYKAIDAEMLDMCDGNVEEAKSLREAGNFTIVEEELGD